MPFLNGHDDAIRHVLNESQTIAVVGHSNNPDRASYQIAQFLSHLGYAVIPVNPMIQKIGDAICYPALADIPYGVDIVNVFRRSEHLLGVIDEAIAIGAATIWAQIGVSDQRALQKALSADLNVIMDTCIKNECIRLGITSEIRHDG